MDRGERPSREPAFFGVARRFLDFKTRFKHTWTSESTSFFLAEARRKWKRYPAHVAAWHGIMTSPPFATTPAGEPGRLSLVIVKERVFPQLVDWFELVFNLGKPCVSWIDGRLVSATSCLIKCRFFIGFEEMKDLEREVADLTDIAGGISERELVRLTIEAILAGLDQVLASDLKSPWHFVQHSNVMDLGFQGFGISLVVEFTRDVPFRLKRAYFEGNLLEFITNELGVNVNDQERQILEEKRLALKAIARKIYHEKKGSILATMNHFHAMASLSGRPSHLYPVLSYVISRLDLGNTSVQVLMEEYARNRAMAEGDELVFGYLFDDASEQALLFSTFQANVTGFKDKLGTLFMIVLQYFLVAIDRRTLSEKLLEGEGLYKNVEAMTGTAAIHRFTSRFQDFLVNHYKVQDMLEYNTLVHVIFKNRLERLLSRFFASFLKTSNEKLARAVNRLNARSRVPREITTAALIDFMGGFLSFGVQEVFLHDDLTEASRMFRDPKNRFSEDNIAMAMMELLLHKDMPFQDTQWMPALVTNTREGLDLAFLPSKPAIDEKLKGLSKDLLQQFTIQDRAEKTTTPLLHDWLFNEILKPFYQFLDFYDSSTCKTSPVAALIKRCATFAPKLVLDARVAAIIAGMLESLLGPGLP